MNRKRLLCYVLFLSFLFTSGCWDRREMNDLAIWLATGWDVGEKEKIQLTGQIVIPSAMQTQSSGGGGGKEFFTISANGRNFQHAMQNLQTKLSRQAFFGQRRVIFLGEEFAQQGLKDKLDVNTRAHDVSIRTDIFVVKGGTGKEALSLSYPLEKPSAGAALKEHKELGGRADTAFLHFLMAANSKGISPTIPVVEIGNIHDGGTASKDDPLSPIIKMAGLAIFDRNLKLVGYLNNNENKDFLWIMGILKAMTVSAPVDGGDASVVLRKTGSKIVPKISKNGDIKFTVSLDGEGVLYENNSSLDVNQPKELKFLEKKLEKQVEKQALKTIKKVQNEYALDIFGFGEIIHQKKPQQWKSLKNGWDQTFAEADISVNVNLTIKQIGYTGRSLLTKESEQKK